MHTYNDIQEEGLVMMMVLGMMLMILMMMIVSMFLLHLAQTGRAVLISCTETEQRSNFTFSNLEKEALKYMKTLDTFVF